MNQDSDKIRNQALQLWYEYGERFDVFAKEKQPAPTVFRCNNAAITLPLIFHHEGRRETLLVWYSYTAAT
ncbi:MAG: hypothetical protein ACLQPD_26950 [Desulfomonilaceae bacterium]